MTAGITNCPGCGKLFVPNKFRDVCDVCFKEEEASFDKVYKFIRKRENRTATMLQVVEGTGVSERLIGKFIKNGRIQVGTMPNLGYPCDKCGKPVKKGVLCEDCALELSKEIKRFNEEEDRKREILERDKKSTYYRDRDDK